MVKLNFYADDVSIYSLDADTDSMFLDSEALNKLFDTTVIVGFVTSPMTFKGCALIDRSQQHSLIVN